jgi:hypothetical protein
MSARAEGRVAGGNPINDLVLVDSLHRLHWGGILAGTLTGLVTYIALGALGVAIGFGTAANLSDIGGLRGIGITGAIWIVISLAVASFLAGVVAARASTDLNVARGRFNGLMTGITMTAILTLVTLGGLSSLATNVGNTVSGVASTALSATTAGVAATGTAAGNAGGLAGIANRLGLGDQLQALQNGLSRDEIAQIIADASPELNQTQVSAAAATIQSIINNAQRNLGTALQNPSELGAIVTKQADNISQALQGDQFSSRLQRRGLSKAQADEVVKVVSARVTELRQQATQTAEAVQAQATEAARAAAAATSSAVWIWLLAVGITLALATLGGGYGSSERALYVAPPKQA